MSETTRAADPAERHHEELALFLSVHLGRAAGLLWAEYDHPACAPGAGQQDLDRLAEGLARRTGRRVRTEPGGERRSGTAAGHLLVHQAEGSGEWRLTGPAGHAAPDPPFRCRLRAGEILYVLPHWAWQARLGASGRFLLTVLE